MIIAIRVYILTKKPLYKFGKNISFFNPKNISNFHNILQKKVEKNEKDHRNYF